MTNDPIDLSEYDDAYNAAGLDIPIKEGYYTARLTAFRVKMWPDKVTGDHRHGFEWKLQIACPGDENGKQVEKFSQLSEKSIPWLKKEAARCFGADLVSAVKLSSVAKQYEASIGRLFKITVKLSNSEKPNVYLDGMIDESDSAGEVKAAPQQPATQSDQETFYAGSQITF